MEKVEVGGVVTLIIGGTIRRVEWVEFDGRAWLAPQWSISLDRKQMSPTHIIAPRSAPGTRPIPGHEVLQLLGEMRLPASLLERADVPQQLEQLVEVRKSPAIWADAPAAMN